MCVMMSNSDTRFARARLRKKNIENASNQKDHWAPSTSVPMTTLMVCSIANMHTSSMTFFLIVKE